MHVYQYKHFKGFLALNYSVNLLSFVAIYTQLRMQSPTIITCNIIILAEAALAVSNQSLI